MRALLLALAALPAPVFAQDVAFETCVRTTLRPGALGAGIAPATFDAAFAGLQPDREVLRLQNNQPEFRTPVWEYLAFLVDDERIAEGRAQLARHSAVLGEIERRYGVDRHTVVAVWGVESNFGQTLGKRPLVQSLATLGCFGRRAEYFRGELNATLRILQRGDIAPALLTGSWAGAFGQTQFMPSTWARLAVDQDGDGRRDIVTSVPDALASTANFLADAGWRTGTPWGVEVIAPGVAATGRAPSATFAQWAARGVRRADGAPLAGETQTGLIKPAGETGPAFLVTRNFGAVYSYNASQSYGLAIAHLSDRLRGGGPFRQSWPWADRPLSRAERRELQSLLIARGFDIGAADGFIGERTRTALRSYQTRAGLPATGDAGGRTLDALRAGR